MNTCFFLGHRDAPNTLFPALTRAVERHITEYGVTEFVVGHYGFFDRMAAQAVIDAKKRHPSVTLVLLLPYHPAERPVDLLPGFDLSFYPPGLESVPKRVAIPRANRYMADHSGYLIAYARFPGTTRELVEHTRRKERCHVENLAEQEKS